MDQDRYQQAKRLFPAMAVSLTGLILLLLVGLGVAWYWARGRTVPPGERTAWDEAIAAIEKEPKYHGLKIAPQTGLIPIGPDPDSKLWEFAHPLTGEIPKRDPVTKKLTMTGESCIVLVLLPGGKFWMGAQKEDGFSPNFDKEAQEDEGPVHEVVLSPFFLSKYEMSQGQWVRVLGSNPSCFKSKEDAPNEDPLLRPVELVSWEDCGAACNRMGLMLPSEAQWEYACRAGTGTPTYGPLGDVAWDDENAGYRTRPIGKKAANAFGLHDMLGNVWEWCEDGYGDYGDTAPRTGDGLRGVPGARLRVFRGATFSYPEFTARSAGRARVGPSFRSLYLGLRPARSITPP